MSVEAARSFRMIVSQNADLRAVITQAVDAGKAPDWVALGKQHGYIFNASEADDIISALAGDNAELSDFELEMVAGGSGLDFTTS